MVHACTRKCDRSIRCSSARHVITQFRNGFCTWCLFRFIVSHDTAHSDYMFVENQCLVPAWNCFTAKLRSAFRPLVDFRPFVLSHSYRFPARHIFYLYRSPSRHASCANKKTQGEFFKARFFKARFPRARIFRARFTRGRFEPGTCRCSSFRALTVILSSHRRERSDSYEPKYSPRRAFGVALRRRRKVSRRTPFHLPPTPTRRAQRRSGRERLLGGGHARRRRRCCRRRCRLHLHFAPRATHRVRSECSDHVAVQRAAASLQSGRRCYCPRDSLSIRGRGHRCRC